MVRKVGGPKSPTTSGVQGTRGPEAAQINSVGQINQTEAKTGVQGARRSTRLMSSAEREELFRMVGDEAKKMFGPDGLPEEKRKQVEGAVRMAISSGVNDEDKTE